MWHRPEQLSGQADLVQDVHDRGVDPRCPDRSIRVATQGILLGIGLSLAAMTVAAFGYLPPLAGAFLQEGIDVLVIANALRANRGAHE